MLTHSACIGVVPQTVAAVLATAETTSHHRVALATSRLSATRWRSHSSREVQAQAGTRQTHAPPNAPSPCQVIKRSSKKTQTRRSSLKAFVKVVNYNHMMPTRYQLDVDLKAVVTPDVLDNAAKKVEARKEAKKLMEEKFVTGALWG